MPNDDLENLTHEELLERVRLLEQGSSSGGSGFPADERGRTRAPRFIGDSAGIADFEKRANEAFTISPTKHSPAGESRAPISVEEAQAYVKAIGATRIAASLARSSSKPTVRKLLSDARPETW